jgi:hypothetical protein
MRHIEGQPGNAQSLAAAMALKALAQGEALPEQQILAYRWIVDVIACTDHKDFALPGDIETMAWRNGRRFVGLEIERLILSPALDALPQDPPARRRRGTAERAR